MKDFFKKYPALIIFIAVAILFIMIFVFYEVIYNTQNRKQQEQYDELNKTAWITDLNEVEDPVSDEDRERAANEAKMKAFLENVEDADYYKKMLHSRPNFEAYWEINGDVIGYLLYPDTGVEYPILQSEARRDYYLKRNLDGSTGFPGCIYTENINAKDFSDPVTISYGHNMQNGTMFGRLNRIYKDPGYLDDHRYIFLYQPEGVSLYEIIAVSSYNDRHLLADNFKKYNSNFMFTGIKPDDQVTVYNNLKNYGDKNAYFKEGEDVTEDDKLFIMSTCRGDRVRTIMVAKQLFMYSYK